MPKTLSAHCADIDSLDALTAHWSLRILINLGGHRRLDNFVHAEDRIMDAIGLSCLQEGELPPRQKLARLRARQRQLESTPLRLPRALKNNLMLLQEQLGLTADETSLLAFTTVLYHSDALDDSADTLGSSLDNARLAQSLAVILDVPVARLQSALSPASVLVQSGLLRIHAEPGRLRNKLLLLDALAACLLEPHADAHSLLAPYFGQATDCTLAYREFAHLGADLTLLTRYLRGARQQCLRGVNVLLYGPPGTGKTALARTLARHLGWPLYEVNMMDAQGEPLSGPDRFRAYQLGQQVLARQDDCLILFDEIEDVFLRKENDTAGVAGKAWVNRLLEENPTPAIWISNRIEHIDRACLRRFDYLLRLDIPPRKVRERMLSREFAAFNLSRASIRRLANEPGLSPAIMARTARVATALRYRKANTGQDIQRVLKHTLTALGVSTGPIIRAETATPFRIDVLNATTDVDRVIDGLKRQSSGRLCLYGPPGTGKTAFGRHLACALDKPLQQARASDLLDPFVGMTEQNIARLFRQAADDDAVLLIDEVDSFLRERMSDDKRWETSAVNEWLTHLETFEGILVVTTNRMEQLEPAALRRFDLKMGFDYLKPSQALTMLRELAKHLELAVPDDELTTRRLARAGRLTPGDFATVQRRMRFLERPGDMTGLIDALAEESRFRDNRTGSSSGIGFLSPLPG